MTHSAARTLVSWLALPAALAAGLSAGRSLRAASGAEAATGHLISPAASSFLVPVASAICIIVLMFILARMRRPLFAMWIGGFGLAGWVVCMGDALEFHRQGGRVVGLVVEAMMWAGGLFLVGLAIDRLACRSRAGHSHRWESPLRLTLAATAGAILMTILTAVIARTAAPGQVLAATTIGSLAAAMLGTVLAGPTARPLWLSLPLMVAFVSYVIGGAFLGGVPKATEAVGLWAGLLLPMPQMYAAGTLLGVPLGIVWGRSLLASGEETPLTAPAGTDAGSA